MSKPKQKKVKDRSKRVKRQLEILKKKNKVSGKKRTLASFYPNGVQIEEYMKEKNVKGDFRDYVILNGTELIDYVSKYFLTKGDSGNLVDSTGIFLVHKKNLKNIIGKKEALRFWHPNLGRNINYRKQKKIKNG